MRVVTLVILLSALFFADKPSAVADGWDVRGNLAFEVRSFYQDPQFPEQEDAEFSPSFKIEPEFIHEWSEGRDAFTFMPFYRLDAHDDNRTHFDIRELNYFHQADSWNITVGIDQIFWGVAESRHLVDIINQKDQVEDIDEEDKLGQPMVNLTLERDFGNINIFVLPFFRERNFPDDKARLRGPLPINEDPEYESSAEENHVDFALRYSRTYEKWDIGISSFWGTSREARLVPFTQRNNTTALKPFYDIINQQSLDLQWTGERVLLKLEAITRSGHSDRFYATVAGFEYTFYRVFGTNGDVGILAEHLFDSRDEIEDPLTVFDNDLFAGLRFSANDPQDTRFLTGATTDLDSGEVLLIIEASRRLGQRWLVECELRSFLNIHTPSPLAGLESDDFLVLRFMRYF